MVVASKFGQVRLPGDPKPRGQNEYFLMTRDPEPVILPLLRSLGIGLVAFSPLGRGMLTGRVELAANDMRREFQRFSGANFDANLQRARALETLAKKKGVTAGRLALAWVLSRGQRGRRQWGLDR